MPVLHYMAVSGSASMCLLETEVGGTVPPAPCIPLVSRRYHTGVDGEGLQQEHTLVPQLLPDLALWEVHGVGNEVNII